MTKLLEWVAALAVLASAWAAAYTGALGNTYRLEVTTRCTCRICTCWFRLIFLTT